MDAHKPYYPPKTYREVDHGAGHEIEDGLAGNVDDSAMVRRTYDGCATYIANAYRRLFSKLREDFEYVITLADHGEHLGENGLWAHTYGLRPELTHVPLVISGEGLSSRTVEDTVSILDVHQTIADIAGIDVDSRGQNLLTGIDPRDRLAEYHGFAPRRRKRFEAAGIGDRFEPMDRPLDAVVSAEGYARETHGDGLVVTGEWSHDDAAERLDELVSTIDRKQPTPSTAEGDISNSVQNRLEDLGYV